MKLTIAERIILGSILPSEGNFITLKIVRQLREALSFSEEEISKLKFEQDGNMVKWDTVAEAEIGVVDIPIGEKAMSIIVDRLLELDKQGRLTEPMVGVFERFVGSSE